MGRHNGASLTRSRLVRAALAGLALAVVGAMPVRAADGPRVIASIVPIHSLVAQVMEGVGQPHLLVSGAASPHDYALRPSDAEALSNADAVFWVGPGLESFLAKSLASLAKKARVVPLATAEGVFVLPVRRGGAWEGERVEGQAARGPAAGGSGPVGRDMHIWLYPANAQALTRAIAATLADVDPANAARYERNRDSTLARLATLDRDIAAAVGRVAAQPFVVFHDAYQYFEHRYGLRAVGSITVSPERAPGPRRIRDLRTKIERLKAKCVFREPSFESGLIATLVEGTDTRVGVLDPEGATVEPGPAAYDALMRRLAAGLVDCLASRS